MTPDAFQVEASTEHGVLLAWPDGGREQLDWSTGVIIRSPLAASPEIWLPEHLSPALPMTDRDLDDIDLMRDDEAFSPISLCIFWAFQATPDLFLGGDA